MALLISILCTVLAAVLIYNLITDKWPLIRQKNECLGDFGYSRRQLDRITASVIRKDRRRARYGINA